jgi:Xaa-Pro dipeptidase
MKLHFERAEYERRLARTAEAIAAAGLDGLVIFKQESMYYLTGYDTAGYAMFQAMYLGADGTLSLLTRSADAYQAAYTSVIEDIRIWADREGATPGDDLRAMLEDQGCRGKRLGVEYHAYGLTAQRGRMVDAALDGFCTLEDASDVVRLVRLVKSEAELACVRRAGALADAALGVANREARPGADMGAVYGRMMSAVMEGGGDPPASRWPMGPGADALLVRYHTDLGTVGDDDQVTFEFGGAYRHYHAALMHTVMTGRPGSEHRRMFEACREALEACEAVLRPGRTVGELYDEHARVLTAHGFGAHMLKACGYTLGIAYPPTWMDWPMFWTGNPQPFEPGMVFFMHMILIDREAGRTMSLGETAIVTEGACEPVCHAPRELVVN